METKVEVYKEHSGTIRVSGGTLPKSAGKCAFYYLQKGLMPDFLVIGGNANQQATKAMGVFCFMVKNSPEFTGIQVAFQPLMFHVNTSDSAGVTVEKTATVWRTLTVGKV